MSPVKTPRAPRTRNGVIALHAQVRDQILDGRLGPGAAMSQVELAQVLGVSRTPLREVLRMLQEEGLVQAETNRRMRVARFDAADLDADYACRILLETLALDLTVPKLTPADGQRLAQLRDAMSDATDEGDVAAWFSIHAEFHALLTGGANSSLAKELRTFADRSIRYIRVVQRNEPGSWQLPGDREHLAIVEAVTALDIRRARAVLGEHLARTALRVLADLAPSYEPVAVRAALLGVGRGSGGGHEHP